MISVPFQGKSFSITVIQVYVPTTNAKEVEVEQFYEDLQDLLELTTKKRCLFHHRRLKCKSKNQEIPGVIGKFGLGVQNQSKAKANRVLPRECTGRSKHLLPTTQEKTTHGHHQMVNTEIRLITIFAAKMGKPYIVSKNKTRS